MREVALQPFDHVQIEVIGRFVQKQQFRIADERTCQSDTLKLPTGEIVRGAVQIVQMQTGENLPRALFVLPRAKGIHFGEQLLHAFAVAPSRSLLPSRYQGGHLIVVSEAGLQYGTARKYLGKLWQVCTADTVLVDHFSGIG